MHDDHNDHNAPGKKWGHCVNCDMSWGKCWKTPRTCCGRCKHFETDPRKRNK